MRLKKKELEVLLKVLSFYDRLKRFPKNLISEQLIEKIHNNLDEEFTHDEKELVLDALNENIRYFLNLDSVSISSVWVKQALRRKKLVPMQQLKNKLFKKT